MIKSFCNRIYGRFVVLLVVVVGVSGGLVIRVLLTVVPVKRIDDVVTTSSILLGK